MPRRAYSWTDGLGDARLNAGDVTRPVPLARAAPGGFEIPLVLERLARIPPGSTHDETGRRITSARRLFPALPGLGSGSVIGERYFGDQSSVDLQSRNHRILTVPESCIKRRGRTRRRGVFAATGLGGAFG